jgi:hypothetical protein
MPHRRDDKPGSPTSVPDEPDAVPVLHKITGPVDVLVPNSFLGRAQRLRRNPEAGEAAEVRFPGLFVKVAWPFGARERCVRPRKPAKPV